MLKIFLVFLIGLLVAIILGFPILKLSKKFHLSQTTLHYVDNHAGKNGTPTMGGFIFILPCLLASLIFARGELYLPILILLLMLGYGLLGFLDDFIKIKNHKNGGLKPYQKIIGQGSIALIVAIFAYFNIGSSLNFFGVELEIGLFVIPFIIFFYVAVTNAVNLVDGLDGLASGVSFVYLIFFGIIIALTSDFNFALIAFSLAGALLGFLLFNCYPAKIFMGDTGSLALGGAIASLAVFSRLELIMPIIGILFVITSLSDVIQVLHYKRTHRRIFKMAPLHHHFEKCGVNENRIVAVYIVITIVCGIGALIGYLFVTGVL